MMKAVVFKKPHEVVVEEREIPRIIQPTDIIVKIKYTALCGSDLHVYRGVEAAAPGFIMGHEFTGIVTEVGEHVEDFAIGDAVVSPFTTSCGQCFYCQRGFSARCVQGQVFGCPALDGAQAEFIRVPLADSTAMKAPEGIDDIVLVLMADIFPTGYFAAANAFENKTAEERSEAVVAVIGCGPVGLCALMNAMAYKPKHVLALDTVPSRLDLARSLGAEPWKVETDRRGLDDRVEQLTGGMGVDVVLEVVGSSAALRLGFDILRPFGFISSVGVHNDKIPWTGEEAYSKNLRIQMGRCPVRSISPQALKSLKEQQHNLGPLLEHVMPLTSAVEAYDLFEKRKTQKVIFKMEE